MHTHPLRGLLGLVLQTPLLLTLFDTAVLDETSVIIIKGLQGMVHRGIGREDRFTRGSILVTVPFPSHHSIDEMRLEATAVVVAPVLGRPILLIGLQPGDAHHFGLQPLGPCSPALAMAHRLRPVSNGYPFARSGLGLGVDGHRHVVFGR